MYPAHKEVVVADDAEQILEAINDRGVTRLLVPDGQPTRSRPTPTWSARPCHSAQRRIRTALVYSPTGQTTGADVLVRGSAHSDAYIDAMLGDPAGGRQRSRSRRRASGAWIHTRRSSLLLAPRG